MSQSRARKQSVGDTVPKGRSSMVKASGDSVPSALHQSQPKQIQSLSKNKIPKNIRYDLENALVGLCDVWFEDIKPHLVRNKIKLHVDTTGATASGDFAPPPAAPGCSHLDPASSASVCELCRLLFNAAHSIESAVSQAASGASSATSVVASATAVASDTPRLDVSGKHGVIINLFDNKHSKSKLPRRRRSQIKAQPLSPTRNCRVPRLCRTYSLLSPQPSPRTQRRRVQTAAPVIDTRKESCLLSLVARSRAITRNKYTQTETYISKSCPHYLSPMKRTRVESISSNINQTKRYQHIIDLMNPESGSSINTVHPEKRRASEKRSKNPACPPRNPTKKAKNTKFLRTTPCDRLEPMDVVVDKVPSRANQNQSPRKHIKKEPVLIQPASGNQRYRSRENRENTNSAPQYNQTRQKRNTLVDPSIAPPARDKYEGNRTKPLTPLPQRNQSPMTQPNGHQFWRCFATTNLIPLKNKKHESRNNQRQPEIEPSMLFDKELVDIIGTRNDKRLRVLYKSPTREEFPSVMNLVTTPSSREKETERNSSKKTLPWRC